MELVHGGDITSYRDKFPDRTVQDFSANINPFGLPDSVRRALQSCADAVIHYPDPLCRGLKAALAEYEAVPQEWVLPGNGASDLICRIAWGLRPKKALLLSPTFAEYGLALAAAGCELTYHDLTEDGGFLVDDAILDRITGVDLVFLCNPNNPTGQLTDRGLLDRILQRCREAGAVLAVDECFLDFVEDGEDRSMKNRLGDADNLLILRAFTKIFAMPGLRLGYLLCGSGGMLARIESAGPPWSVSVPAQLCGVAAVGETAYLQKTREMLPVWRAQLSEGLSALGCRVYPAAANYIFFRSREGLAADLPPRGFLLRDCANFRGLAPGYYRTAVRSAEENAALLAALKETI